MARQGLSVSLDFTPFVERIIALRPPKLDRAVALGLVDTAKTGIAKAATVIAKRTGLKSARVKKALFYDRVRVGQYSTFLRSSKKPIPLIEFSARQANAGVYARRPWGEARVFPGTFIATMKSGHKGVYRRTSRDRLPIKEVYGPTIYSTFAQPDVQEEISLAIAKRLPVALARRIKAEMRRRG